MTEEKELSELDKLFRAAKALEFKLFRLYRIHQTASKRKQQTLEKVIEPVFKEYKEACESFEAERKRILESDCPGSTGEPEDRVREQSENLIRTAIRALGSGGADAVPKSSSAHVLRLNRPKLFVPKREPTFRGVAHTGKKKGIILPE